MTRALKDNKVFELETIIDSVTLTRDKTKESDKIYSDLRMHLIHSQLCIAKHFKFKKEQREKRELKASLVLKKALVEEKQRKQMQKNLSALMRGEVIKDTPEPVQNTQKHDIEYDSDGNEIKDNFKRL